MRLIVTTGGDKFKVDDGIYDLLSRFNWHTRRNNGNKYAMRTIRIGDQRKTTNMARVIASAPTGLVVDHINGNTQDNQMENLRLCTHRENCCNKTHLVGRNKTGVIGVSWNKAKRKWTANIKVNYRSVYLGAFTDKNEAIHARRGAAQSYYGEFAPRL